jgi:hypothetical protein
MNNELKNEESRAISRRFGNEEGMTLLITMLALFIIALTGVAISRVAQTEIEIAGNYRNVNRAFYAADGGAEYGLNELLGISRARGRFPNGGEMAAVPAPALAGMNFTNFALASAGPQTTGSLTTGFYQGLIAVTQPFSATVTVDTALPPFATSTVAMTADFDIIPIFQFAIFYEEDLEILPGADMVLNGRVHSNQDIYIGTHATLTVDSVMTSAGDIFNRRKDDGSLMGGPVSIRDSTGVFQAMAGLDSDHPDWVTEAIDRWDGNVRSGEHDVDRLNLTIEDPTQPYLIIEAAEVGDSAADQDAKMWYESDLRIINGQGFDNAGNPINLIDPISGTSAVTYTVIFDQREQKHMLTQEIDMQKLGNLVDHPVDELILYVGGYEPDGAFYPAWGGGAAGVGPPEWAGYVTPWDPANDTEFAVKLSNGSELQTPTTVVSDNPSYVRGNYNSINKKGAAVIADAVTFLSNRWGDVNGDGDTTDAGDGDLAYSEQAMGNRNAWDTTVNAALMLGNTDTVAGVQYNGGVENVLRFMERWSGRTLTYRGSIIDLWNARIATGDWIYGDPIYTAPNRNWSFDTDFLDPANLPPGTPNVYIIRVIGWERVD